MIDEIEKLVDLLSCSGVSEITLRADGRRLTLRKAHAAPFAATARVPRDKFNFRSGEDKLRSFESSPGKLRRFCSVCGSHVLAERPADPHVVLRIATLDDDPGARPLIHIWKSHEVPWCDWEGDIKRFAEWP